MKLKRTLITLTKLFKTCKITLDRLIPNEEENDLRLIVENLSGKEWVQEHVEIIVEVEDEAENYEWSRTT